MNNDELGLWEDVLAYLQANHVGAANAVQRLDLACVFGVTESDVTTIVHKLRSLCQPVCHDENGYFYAENGDEISDTILQLCYEISKINSTIQSLVISHQWVQSP